jgi:hypothetical protein
MAYLATPADLVRDRDAILGLWQRNAPEMPFPEEQFEQRCCRNPAGPARLWLLRTTTADSPIGVNGFLPRKIQVDHREVLAGRVWGAAVDRSHRTLGPVLMLFKAMSAALEEDVGFLYCLPFTRPFLAVCTRFGFRQAGTMKRYTRPLRVGPYLSRTPSLQHRPSLLSAACRLAPLADLALRAVFPETRKLPALSLGYTIREQTTFDERFTDLWRRRSSEPGLLTCRTASFLNWRFSRSSFEEPYQAVGMWTRRRPRLAGYFVYHLFNGQAVCGDLVAENDEGALDDLFAASLLWVRARGADSMVLRGCLTRETILRRLKAYAFQPRQTDEACDNIMVYPGPKLGCALDDKELDWCFLGADDL